MTKFYAGIGSRETPERVLNQMNAIAIMLQQDGWTLRSGGAVGADTAFERGAGVRKEIFYARDADAAAMNLAEQYHPAWHRCSSYAQKLLARNGFQILGHDLKTPSRFVVCWTKDGGPSGGTGQAIRVAMAHDIPVFNLQRASAEGKLRDFLTSLVW